ncbi:stress response protein NST1-like [Pyrus ussuriensis x Pyrus communis]|uniref:Stress response protein NST1-like n=1 Tax=Pyrus ussuriensis x Pyrus communis TaxID=2448454 RepID=A0A5N5EWK7_9ROSA|nr:stress response protein NST1-like [Pyrus ussuriensis x Pyrus communis]
MSPKVKHFATKKKSHQKPPTVKCRVTDDNYVQIRLNLIAFAELLQELKPKLDEKLEVLAFIYKDIYWSSTANEFSYHDNIAMKEDMDGFLGDDRVTNTVIDAHKYILREQESNLDHQNFYFLVNLFVSYKY